MDLDRVKEYAPARAETDTHSAAVLAPVIYCDAAPHLLFTKRADHLGEHPGQMAFPGGSREPSDESLWATAVREAGEEIGLRREEPECIGQLDDILTVTDYSVTPFVACVPNRGYVPDQREVAEIVTLPLAGLTDPTNYEAERRDHPHHGDVVVPFFHVNGYTVWGATARMVVQLLELTTDWRDPQRVDHLVDTDPEL